MFKFIKSLFMPKGIKITAGELADKFGMKLKGDSKTIIKGIAPIADAKAGQIAFYSTEKNSEAFKILPIEVLENTKASIIILQPEQVKHAPKNAVLLVTESPRGDVVKILGEIYKEKLKYGIHWAAHVEKGVFIRKKRKVYVAQFATVEKGAVLEIGVRIYPGAFIGKNVILGAGTVVHSGAHIENASIGKNCVIHSNAVVGKDGFGFTRQDGENVFIPHVGRVILGDRVSIGANSCVDRGVMTDTIIGDGTKIDNLCQIAHGVIIGKECFLASGVGIAGGAIIGNKVLIGGQVGISNKSEIGDNVEIGPQSGVFRNIKENSRVIGSPAIPSMEYLRTQAWISKQVKK